MGIYLENKWRENKWGQSKIKNMGICRSLFLFTLNFTLTPFIFYSDPIYSSNWEVL